MSKFSVARSITIDAPVDKVYETVLNFNDWPKWSPWLIVEPDCQVDFASDGQSYSWDGKVVGSGKMEIVNVVPNERIDYQLTFLKPWKSEAQVSFSFASQGSATEATWTMDSSLPFFMFWMKKTMVAMIGMDYERGLGMLKDFIETGSPLSKLEFKGAATFKGFSFVGIRTRCPISNLGEMMENDFKKLKKAFTDLDLRPSGKSFSIYHDFNLVKGEAEYTSGIPVENPPTTAPDGMLVDNIETGQTYQIAHVGPYKHLGNPWSAGMMHSRAKVFKQSKKQHPFEIYNNDPTDVPEGEIKTTVHFPIA